MTRTQYEAQIQELAKELEKAEAERDHWAKQCEEMFRILSKHGLWREPSGGRSSSSPSSGTHRVIQPAPGSVPSL